MSATVTPPPAAGARRLERLEVEFLRSPSASWPPAPEQPVGVDVPRAWVDDDDEDESEPGMTLYRTTRYCCR